MTARESFSTRAAPEALGPDSGEDRKTVLSGMRPTGRLHLGNYWGALKNWVRLQDEYDCWFFVADWHMLTTGYEETGLLQQNIREMTLDWLAAGLDPRKSTLFWQSKIPQHAELSLMLSMLTPISWLENNPTYKEQLQELGRTKLSKAIEEVGVPSKQMREKLQGQALEPVVPDEGAKIELRTHGFLGYPVLQAADILLYDAAFVPVGQDQLPHLELSREIARRFNSIYGPVLVEPKALTTETPKVPGIDGRKMSKSYGNAVDLAEPPETLKAKVLSMFTDPLKIRKNDLGHPAPCPENPSGCVVFALHRLYSGFWESREGECRRGEIGCVACKNDLLKSLEGPFSELRANRERCANEPVEDILEEGSARAREAAERTMERVRKAMNLR
ncbi:MAG: tryptophan--tRNA ligase [Elusimicrobia bacterium]|nr:tryptophan--tRNA ligase [Elusimicrobiota bacterium]